MLILRETTLLFDTPLNSCYTARLFGIDKSTRNFPASCYREAVAVTTKQQGELAPRDD
jgi:hypothetical protein